MKTTTKTTFRVEVFLTTEGESWWTTVREFFSVDSARIHRREVLAALPHALVRIVKEETVTVSTVTIEEVW